MAEAKDYLIKLTLAVYKVTGLFPEKEPLKYQIRGMANEILAELICAKSGRQKEDPAISLVEKIKAFLRIAGFQNWVKEENIAIIIKEYEKISESFFSSDILESKERSEIPQKQEKSEKKTPTGERKPKIPPALRIPPEKRQEKIMNLLYYKKRINLSELKKIFGQVSARTLRRDMESLAEAGIIDRKREGQKDVSYWILDNQKTNRSDSAETGHNADTTE